MNTKKVISLFLALVVFYLCRDFKNSYSLVCPQGIPPEVCAYIERQGTGPSLGNATIDFSENLKGGPKHSLPYSVREPFYRTRDEQVVNGTILQEKNVSPFSVSSEVLTSNVLQKGGETNRIEKFHLTNYGYANLNRLREQTEEPKILEGIYFRITPEKKYYVQLSSVDVNRFVCPGLIRSVVFSEERGVIVEISDNNAFVKFKITKEGEKLNFSTVPVDLYIVCNNKVYNVVGVPTQIPGVTVYMIDPTVNLEELQKNLSIPYEHRLANLIRDVFRGENLDSALRVVKNKKVEVHEVLDVTEIESFKFEIEGFEVRVFEVKLREDVLIRSKSGNSTFDLSKVNVGGVLRVQTYSDEKDKGNKKLAVKLSEYIFLKPEISYAPLAVSLESLVLRPGTRIRAILVERLRQDFQEGKGIGLGGK